MNAKHTPAPWKVWRDGNSVWIDPPDPSMSVICDIVPRGDWMTDEDEANASLIAASPDHALFASAIAAGIIRYELATQEICVNGLRYTAPRDEFGVPMLHAMLRAAILEVQQRAA